MKDFQEGKIKITTVDDLRKLVEMDLHILKDDYVMSKNAPFKKQGARKKESI
ncbi:hypothetical protein [Paenibacillus humicus]|uniref:hypothetical protein n=1 Tax=Paenibacillus humicus TaxID=412861 RepID=UPI001FE7CC22|nr:hypothetical protein [Paenibacillus humicus]